MIRLFGRIDDLAPSDVDLIVRRGLSTGAAPFPDVTDISEAVRTRGDAALFELTERFDHAKLNTLEVPRERWKDAQARMSASVIDALHAAHANIERFHRACLPVPIEIEVVRGLMAGKRNIPHHRVGVYVPGGRAAYPSTVLMTVCPAKVAGVNEVIVCTPPGPDGTVSDATLAACAVAGADRVFTVGGAQAIFALARGTQSIPRCDKIVGPGNAWVAAAKALVAGEVAIDAPAGPSEVLVIADETANPTHAALEMLAQAEHDPAAASVVVTTSEGVAKAILDELGSLAKDAPRGAIIRAALHARGAVLVAANDAQMLGFSDRYAPEHVVILTREPRVTLSRLHDYGSAFLGPWASVAMGDYASGPNHVLPTAGLARSYSPLGVEDFLRRPTHQAATREALERLAPIVETLAALEGLPNHAAAVRARRDPK
ncbi:MAG: histidinol dehydrogenase [Candidatus Thermoplasmatota archaeon]